MLNGLIKNIMVKSIVTVLLSTNTIGNTTTETKTVENIDNNTKIEEIANEEVNKKEEEEAVKEKEVTEMKNEEEVEEDIYEWKDEIIAEEIANNPNFEEQYNELLNIYNDYNEIIYYRSPNYMKEQHAQVKDLWRKDWKKQLYAMELDENSILAELRVALISLVSVDYGDEHCRDIISRINNNL
ncbi:MAG: hypothetical protein ACI4XR_02860 [Bacilli bacterium]